jgi:acetate kinase
MDILVINCGSSSLKYAVIDPAAGTERCSGLVQRLGTAQATFGWKRRDAKGEEPLGAPHDHRAGVALLIDRLRAWGLADDIGGIGHRVVHGGPRFAASQRIDAAVIAGIEECVPLGPLHNPPNLVGIRVCQELFPRLAQVAVFDTAFHQTMPEVAATYAVPLAWRDQWQVRRYGFHGTSHRFVAAEALRRLGRGVPGTGIITVHLGNGCSAAAIKDGKCVDTTMGLTPLEGLVMGTRSGSLDPALIGYVAKRSGMSCEQVIDALNKQSGLLGVSGLSNDMRTLIGAAGAGDARARLAIDIFCYVLAKTIAALAVPLGKLDAVVFTGGIGENSVAVRAQTLGLLGVLGVDCEPELNAVHGRDSNGRISRFTAPQALVVPTNEELMIARDTADIIGRA